MATISLRRRLQKLVPLLVLPLAVVGGFASSLRDRLSEAPFELIKAPTEWVAFQSELTVTHAGSDSLTRGRFYRNADGSTRLETGPTLADIRLVFIRNMAEKAMYTWSLSGGWSSEPFSPFNGGAPDQWRKGLPAWVLIPARVGAIDRSGGERLLDAYEIMGEGSRIVRVPALNFWEAEKNVQGRRETHKNIRLLEPDSALFVPTAGAPVKERPQRLRKSPPTHEHSHSPS